MSHTSLPSQTGPMAAMTARRSRRVLPTGEVDDADAEVEAVEHRPRGEHRGDDEVPERGHGSRLLGDGRRGRRDSRDRRGAARDEARDEEKKEDPEERGRGP